MQDLTGRTLGHYRMIERIGAGGNITTYRAQDLDAARTVLLSTSPAGPATRQAFEDSARSAAALDHANILPIYDYGEEDDTRYVAMMDIGGNTLRSMTARGPLPLHDVVDFAAQIADALQYAHRHDTVHGRLHASSVFVGADKRCYVTGFALPGDLPVDCLSPEQCVGRPAHPRSDVYSLGALTYEMLTGRPPYEGESDDEIKRGHVEGRLPSPSGAMPHVPPAVEGVVLRALAKDPQARYRSPAAFADALRSAVNAQTVRRARSASAVRAVRLPDSPSNPVLEYAGDEWEASPTLPDRRTPRWWPLLVLLVMLILGVILAILILSEDDTTNGADLEPNAVPTEVAPDLEQGAGINADHSRDFHAWALPWDAPRPTGIAERQEVGLWLPNEL